MNNKENNEEEKSPGKIKMFFEYYKYVPGFKALVKLFMYFIFFAVIISVVACNQDTIREETKKETTEEQQKTEKTYKDMLDELVNNDLKILYNISINEKKFQIEATKKDNVLSGIYRTQEKLHEFKINDNIIYEIGLNEEKENPELFKELNLTFILPDQLVILLENNKATKMLSDGVTLYNYEIDAIKYQVEVKDDKINKINISSESFNYAIEYNKSEVNES